jgi:hypothetical protein
MRASLAVLLLISLLPAAYPGSTGCATCDELANAPQTGIFVLMNSSDASNQHIDIVAYYDNITASPSRQNLSNSILLIEVANTSGLYVVQKTYTNAQGKATFKFNQWNNSCITFKVMYCPYCVPTDIDCEGFKQCLNFSKIQTTANNSDQILPADDAGSVPSPLNPGKYLPQIATASYCPPPQPLSATPAICLPLIIIFSLLSGALYLTGRNPFAGFNIGGQRIGQHIRYQARGRGFQFSVTQALVAAASVASAGVSISKQGMKGFAKKEAAAVAARGFYNIGSVKQAISAGRSLGAQRRVGGITGQRGGTATVTSGSGGGLTQTAGGMMATAGGGGGYSGADIFSSRGGLISAIGRIALFIGLNTILGRAIDSVYSAATYNPQAGRGQSIFEAVFVDHSQRITDGAATLQALRGENGGWRVAIGPGNSEQATVLRETRNSDGSTTLVLATPSGAHTADGQITVNIGANGTISNISFNMAGVIPPTRDNPQGTSQVTLRSSADGGLQVTARFPDPQHPDGPMVDRPIPLSENMQLVYSSMPASIQPGHDGSDLIAGYNATMQVVGDMTRTITDSAAMDMARRRDEVTSQLGSNPAFRDAVVQMRYDAAAQALGTTLGVDPGDLRVGGHSDLFDGVSRDSDSVGQRGRYEVAAESVARATDSSGVGDAGSLVRASGLSEGSAGAVALTRVIQSSSATELAAFSSGDRSGLVTAFQAQGMNERDAQAAANAVQPAFFTTADRQADSFRSNLASQGFNQQFVDRMMHADTSAVSALASTGRLMSADAAPDLISSNPAFLARADVPESAAQTVRDLSYTRQVYDSARSMVQPVVPNETGGGYRPAKFAYDSGISADSPTDIIYRPPSGSSVESQTAAAERLHDVSSDALQVAMVNRSAQDGVIPTSSDAYTHSTRAFDSGLQYYHMESQMGIQPTTPEPVLAQQELQRRQQIGASVESGDFSTARAEVGRAIVAYSTAADSARAVGDTAAVQRFEAASRAYASAYSSIDAAQGDTAHTQGQGQAVVNVLNQGGDVQDIARATVSTRDSLIGRHDSELRNAESSIRQMSTEPPRPPETHRPQRPPMGDFPTRGEPGGSDSDSRVA